MIAVGNRSCDVNDGETLSHVYAGAYLCLKTPVRSHFCRNGNEKKSRCDELRKIVDLVEANYTTISSKFNDTVTSESEKKAKIWKEILSDRCNVF
jgi:hypothetical protein